MRTRPPHVVPLILASCGALLLASCAAHAPPAPPSAPAAPAAPAAHAASAASGARSPHDAGADFPWAAPELARLVSARDGATGAPLAWDALLDELAGADTVFLGETHTDGTTHRVELGVYDGLLARRGGRVVLALEMLERDVQGALDDYLAGRSGEAAFLAASRPWSNYATAYRPLIERAREAGRPVVASNFPRTLRGQVGKEGAAALDALRASGSRDIPSELLANTDGYWRRVDNAVRGHQAMLGAMPGAMGDVSAQARLISVQSLWDNTMGESCARALDEHPGDLVLHVNGGFHSAYRDGTVRQLRLRKPQARVLTVAIVPVDSPATADVAGLPEADYVVFAEARSRDVEHGEGAVMVPREVRYRLHVPPQASGSARVPLLLWLSDDGLLAEDELELLRARLGDEIAIAVVEAPAVELQEDLAPGGRWFTSDDFTQDAEGVRLGVERTWALLLQQQPVDPARVCLAGAGTGATAVAATALLAERLGARCIAWQPRGDASIRDIPLPLPELRGDQPRPDVSLRVLAGPRTSAWWKDELAGYAGVGLPAELVALSADPWTAPLQFENELREALGLPARAEASVAAPTASA
ncbi:MAG TPA: ChaN family lipoprotein, partial [Planctomycetota bacterium]|nr:ChaN family lipoprotein [Planctomycetota bacterium]